MPRNFHVVPASDSIVLDADGKGQVSYTVTNARTTSARRKAVIVPAAQGQDWYAIEGDPERLFSGNETLSYQVSIHVPPGTPAGRHSFRLNMVDPANPDEDVTEGQSVGFQVVAGEVKQPFRWWIVAVAAVALVAVGLGVYFMLPKGVALPELIGKDFAEAAAWLEEHELALIEVQEVLEEESALVLAQEPDAGAKLAKGSEVTLTRAMPFIEVPKLAGLKTPAALEQLAALMLTVGEVEELQGLLHDADTVVSQEPAAGERVRPETAVALTIEAPVRAVPELRGMDWSAAVERLGELGLEHETNFQAQDASKAGQVVDQQPTSGLSVQKGGTVRLTAEQGRIATPSVTGLSLAQAKAQVEAAKLSTTVAPAVLFPTGAPGTIGAQEPVQGTLLTEGATITLIPVGKGVPVPKVTTLTIDQATGVLKKAGLNVTQSSHFTREVPVGQVMAQSPAVGTAVLEGSAVNCEVASNKLSIVPGLRAIHKPIEATFVHQAKPIKPNQ